MNAFLYQVSGELLALERKDFWAGVNVERHRFIDTDSIGFFRELLKLDADWVVNLD